MSEANNHEKLRELTWRRNLSQAERTELESWLAAHPEECEAFALEVNLTRSLDKLPDTPVSSNFTALVLDQARLELKAGERKPTSKSPILKWRWLVRTATAVVLLSAAGITWKQVESARTAEEMARSVSLVSEIPSLPNPELLRDFDTIQALNQAPPADEELLALLK